MKINSIGLTNFRNHEILSINFNDPVTAIIGRNGLGKTNIVEAIHYAATLKSHRTHSDIPLIKQGSSSAFINLVAQKHERIAAVSVTINRDSPNVFEVNNVTVRRAKDVVGIIKTVIFSPEDLALAKGDPAVRREFIDDFIIQNKPRMLDVKQNYERVLKQRNSLLKSLIGKSLNTSSQETLFAWNEQLIKYGSELVEQRIKAITELRPFFEDFGNQISGSSEPLKISYQSSWLLTSEANTTQIQKEFESGLTSRQSEEVARGQTLVGPHRDDISLELADMPVRNFASHGQAWSVAIALRLATFYVLRNLDTDPILILDDVFAELDANRRQRLIACLTNVEQTIITVADEKDLPTELNATQVWLPDGIVHADN